MSLTFTQQKKPTSSLITAYHSQQDHQAAFQPPKAEEALPQPGFGHEFGKVDVHSGGRTGQQFASSCPLSLSTPQACPLGGACHTCPAPVQAKLTISQPGDKYEQEADRVADQVMAMPEPAGRRVQRECGDCEEDKVQRQPKDEEEEEVSAKLLQRQPKEDEEEEVGTKLLQRQDAPPKPEEEEEEEPEGTVSPKLLQRQEAGEGKEEEEEEPEGMASRMTLQRQDAPSQPEEEKEEEEPPPAAAKGQPGHKPVVSPGVAADIQALRSGGQPLPESTRVFFEPRFGHDFSRVRVHTDARAADTAQAVQAMAFTVGRDVVFGTGQYAPDSQGGRRLMAHELAHVVQQTGGPQQGVHRNHNVGQYQIQCATGMGDPECPSLLEQIRRLLFGGGPTKRGLLERFTDLRNDPHNLQWNHWSKSNPHPDSYGSIEGHQEAIRNQQRGLRKRLNKWNSKNCDDPDGPSRLPKRVWHWATRPTGNPLPKVQPVSPRSPADISLSDVIKALIVLGLSISLAAIVLAAVLDPEPVSKLALAGLSVVMIGLLLNELGIEDGGATEA